MNKVNGIHHISSTVGHAQRNVDFMTSLLGLRLVKNTLNYDDRHLFHFYFGNKDGSTGLITTFPYSDGAEGIVGGGQVARSIYAVPKGSLDFWMDRLESFGIEYEVVELFGQNRINFSDLDGLEMQFVERDEVSDSVWETEAVKKDHAFIGIHSAQLISMRPEDTLKLFTDTLGYKISDEDGNRTILKVHDALGGEIELSKEKIPMGRMGKGTVHHIALHVNDEDIEKWREKLIKDGYTPTEVKDRNYFKALYFREPGGILIELSTESPGVLVDESIDELGTNFIIPKHFTPKTNEIMNEMMPIFIRDVKAFTDYGYRNKEEYDLLENKKELKKEISDIIKTSKSRSLTEEEADKYKELKLEYLRLGRNIK